MKYLLLLNSILLIACGSLTSKKNNRSDKPTFDESVLEPIYLTLEFNREASTQPLMDLNLTQCESNTEFPKGLVLSKACVMHGKPITLVDTAKPHLISAKSVDGKEVMITLNLKIEIPNYIESPQYFYLDEVYITNVTDHLLDITSCESQPSLPKGLSLDPNKGCQIQGSPEEMIPEALYSIKIQGKNRSFGTINLKLQTSEKHPVLQDNQIISVCSRSVDQNQIPLENSGALIKTCKINPSLPSGLSLNPENCMIEGRTEQTFTNAKYTITAHSELGYATTSLRLNAINCDRPKLILAQEEERFDFYQDYSSTSIEFKNLSTVPIVNCQVSPTLPEGLNIDPKSCQIDGTAIQSSTLQPYTITAFDEKGESDTIIVSLIVKNDFISEWETIKTLDGRYLISLPTIPDGNYDFEVDWGDGTSDKITSHHNVNRLHFYEKGGTYTLRIRGKFHGFKSSNGKGYLLDVKQFGSLRFMELEKSGFFSNEEKLTGFSATDDIDLYGVKSIRHMFATSKLFNDEVKLNTSHITDMESMFDGAESFDSPIHMITSNVRSMKSMFKGATAFNQPIGFDTGNVVNMEWMFFQARSFNQPLKFNTSNVNDMKYMFYRAVMFNQVLEFDTSKVTRMDAMFSGATSFNKPINFNTSSVVSFSNMFALCRNFDQTINFDFSKARTLSNMFKQTFLSPLEADKILIQLAELDLGDNMEIALGDGRTHASDEAVTKLLAKGWDIESNYYSRRFENNSERL